MLPRPHSLLPPSRTPGTYSTPHISLPLPTQPPDTLSPSPADDGNTASQQAEQVNKTASTVTLSHPLEGSEQYDWGVVATGADPGITAFTHAPTPTIPLVLTSLPNTPSESCDADVAANSPHLAPPSIPASRPPLSSTLPHLRPCGLVNTKNICFANAVLQLLVNSPPFRNLFRELGYLKEQRGAGVPETGSGATPLVDATVRFLKEFLVEESPSTQQQSPPDTGGTSRADEDKKAYNVVDFFEPTYMYDAMKEKRQLTPLFDGQQQAAEEFLCLYFDALHEELIALPGLEHFGYTSIQLAELGVVLSYAIAWEVQKVDRVESNIIKFRKTNATL